jgi:hypothetical protein
MRAMDRLNRNDPAPEWPGLPYAMRDTRAGGGVKEGFEKVGRSLLFLKKKKQKDFCSVERWHGRCD